MASSKLGGSLSARQISPLTAGEHAVLAAAAADVDEIGRIRGSYEVHGRQTRLRGRMLLNLRQLELAGYVTRKGYHWDSGTVTAKGRRLLATTVAPVSRAKSYHHIDHGIAADGGTRFKKSLYDPGQAPILAKGIQSAKLGIVVTKGRHKHLKMRYVTLEEGRTCPLSCAMRSRCYGGNMPLAKRLEWRGEKTGKVIADAIRQAGPVMLRLHNLGDFPSLQYAERVFHAIKDSGSAAFGFTHHQPGTLIGDGIRMLAALKWSIFSIRTSYLHGTRAPILERSAVIVERAEQAAEHNAIVCPEQLGKVGSCAECGYCWHSQRPVAFVLHAELANARAAGTIPALTSNHREAA